MSAWFAAFLVTQIVEVPLYGWVLRAHPHRWWLAFGASALTHPIVYWIFPLLPASYLVQLSYAEAFAVLAEAVWLARFGVKQSVWWALLANGLSLGVGLTLRSTLGWP